MSSIIRDITLKAQKDLQKDDILLFVGARQAGKTTILKQLQDMIGEFSIASHFLNLEDIEYRDLLDQSPKNLLKIFPLDLQGKTFVFVDEVQYLRNPTNFLKYLYDEYKGRIKIVASGSSAFYLDRKFTDSLAGRKKIFYVLTLSFQEFLRFKGEDELAQKNLAQLALSEQEKIFLAYQEYLLYGGYPRVVLAPLEEKKALLQELAYSYIKKDIYEANIRQEEIFYKLVKLLALQVGSLVNTSELASTLGVSKSSIDNYLYVLQKSFHVRLVKPFYRNVRKELTKMPKVYFLDSGLRNFFADNFTNLLQREDRGTLLENAVFRQLIGKHEFDEIRFWRTTQDYEVDFVVGAKEAFEVKMASRRGYAKKYQHFLENYPEIAFRVVSLDRKEGQKGESLLFPWEI